MMKKILSILILVTILGSMVLPAAAEMPSKCVPDCILPAGHDGACITEIAIQDPGNIDDILCDLSGLKQYLSEQGYTYNGGNLTFVLPEGDIPGFTCNVALENKKTLTIKGSSDSKTQITGAITLSDASDYIRLENLHFDAADQASVHLNNHQGVYILASCSFLDYETGTDFAVYAPCKEGAAPKLIIDNNNCSTITSSNGKVTYGLPISISKEIAVYAYAGSSPVTLGLEASITRDHEKISLHTGDSVKVPSGGSLKYQIQCDFLPNAPYFVINHDGKWLGTAVNDASSVSFSVTGKGIYTIVKKEAPKLKITDNTAELSFTKEQLRYIQKGIEIVSPYDRCTVTYKNNKVTAALKNGILSFNPGGNDGTYVIKKTDTSSSSGKKTTVTKRYTPPAYQNYYAVYTAGFTKAMKSVQNDTLTFDCTPAGRKPISLPVESMSAAAEKGLSVTLLTKHYALKLDAAALKALAQQAQGDTVLLEYNSLNQKTLSKQALTAIDNHIAQHPGHIRDLAFKVSAATEGSDIEDLQRGTITVTVPFIVLPGTEGLPNETYALMGDGSSEPRTTIVEDGYLTTVVTDLTEHMVFLAEAVPEETITETTEETIPETTMETFPLETETLPEPEEPEAARKDLLLPLCFVTIFLLAGTCIVLLLQKRK